MRRTGSLVREPRDGARGRRYACLALCPCECQFRTSSGRPHGTSTGTGRCHRGARRTPPGSPPGHRPGLRVEQRPGGEQGARRTARPRRVPGDHPQRHGRARGAGLHHPAAHQRRARAHRQGLPPVRRPPLGGQAAVGGRAQGDRAVPRRRRRPARRAQPQRPAAGPDHPPGGRRPVPDPLAQRRPSPRGDPGGHLPADAGADHRHRPGRAARHRVPPGRRRRGRGRTPRVAQLRLQRRQARRGRRQGARSDRRRPASTCGRSSRASARR